MQLNTFIVEIGGYWEESYGLSHRAEQSRVQYVLLWRFYQTNSFSHPVRETPDIEHATETP